MEQKKYVKLGFINTLTLGMLTVLLSNLLPQISETFSLDYVQRGSVTFAHSIAFSIAALVSAQALSKFSYSKVIFFCNLMGGIAMLCVPFAGWLPFFIVLVVIIAASIGSLEGSLITFIDASDKANSVYNVNFGQVFFSVGAIVAPLIIGFVLERGAKWQYVYAAFSILFLVMAFVFVKVPLNPKEKTSNIKLSRVKALFKDKRILLLIISLFCYTGAEGAAWNWMSSFMKDSQNLSDMTASIALGLFWFGMLISRMISAKLTKKVEVKNQIIGWAALSVIATVAAGFVNSVSLSLVMAFMRGFAYSGIWSLIVSQAAVYRSDEVEIITPVMVFTGSLGIAFVSLVVGVIAKQTSVSIAIASPALLFMFVIVAMFILKRIEKK